VLDDVNLPHNLDDANRRLLMVTAADGSAYRERVETDCRSAGCVEPQMLCSGDLPRQSGAPRPSGRQSTRAIFDYSRYC
jgi:hypothetical protein